MADPESILQQRELFLQQREWFLHEREWFMHQKEAELEKKETELQTLEAKLKKRDAQLKQKEAELKNHIAEFEKNTKNAAPWDEDATQRLQDLITSSTQAVPTLRAWRVPRRPAAPRLARARGEGQSSSMLMHFSLPCWCLDVRRMNML